MSQLFDEVGQASASDLTLFVGTDDQTSSDIETQSQVFVSGVDGIYSGLQYLKTIKIESQYLNSRVALNLVHSPGWFLPEGSIPGSVNSVHVPRTVNLAVEIVRVEVATPATLYWAGIGGLAYIPSFPQLSRRETTWPHAT